MRSDRHELFELFELFIELVQGGDMEVRMTAEAVCEADREEVTYILLGLGFVRPPCLLLRPFLRSEL